MEHFSIRTQERLARQAMARHRGAGLLRDLIENLENRARDEQRRRRTRSRQNQQRRRVRVEDSVDEFLNAPETANRPELVSACLIINYPKSYHSLLHAFD